MKKTLLISGIFIGSFFNSQAQVTIFQDSFETYTDFSITGAGIGNWRTLDIDGSTTYTGGGDEDAGWQATWPNAGALQAFQVFNPSTAGVTNIISEEENRNFDPRTGNKYMASWAAVMPGDGTGGAGPNNDWLISPVINLQGATGSSLSVWVKSMSDSYGLEKYRIGVYVGTGNPTSTADFTLFGLANLTAPYPAWGERVQSLSAYDGQSIRIGIRCVSADAYMFMVDDFKITATSLSTKDVLANKFSVYPNPANNIVKISNTSNYLLNSVSISDLNGRTVKTLKLNGEASAQINISDLSSGIYMMNISSDQGSVTKKIVKN